MNQTPLISVIIPCYNCEHFLREAVDSSLAQSYPNVEVIVVNDGSIDGSAGIMQSYGSRIVVITQVNSGLAAARNAGIRASRGEYLAFLDSDDWWDPEFLAKMEHALKESDAGIAYCGWQNVGLAGGRGKPFIPPDYEELPNKLEMLLENTRWPVHGALTHRSVVEKAGGFDEERESCEDFAFWLEGAISNRLVCVPEVLAYYRWHDQGQLSNRLDRLAYHHWQAQRKFLRGHPEVARKLGRKRVRTLTHGELLRHGYVCYWGRNLGCARTIFRRVMRHGYGSLRDWKYMLPSLLPLFLHEAIIQVLEGTRGSPAD